MALDEFDSVIEQVLRRMLRPIVRMSLRYSFKLQELTELVKRVFIEIATEELAQQGKQYSQSRVSVMTGVHRKDVARIESDVSGNNETRENLIAKIMVQWQHHPSFTTKSGKPRVLHCEGKESEFANLVKSINGADLNPYTVLFEMERLGIAERKRGTVKLLWRDFVSSEDVSHGLQMLARDSEDLAFAVQENLFRNNLNNDACKNLHLRTEFDDIVPDALPEIKSWILEEGSLFHSKLRKYLAQFDRELNPALKVKQGGARVAFGSFSLTKR